MSAAGFALVLPVPVSVPLALCVTSPHFLSVHHLSQVFHLPLGLQGTWKDHLSLVDFLYVL